jgi:hypothetical protein
VRELQRDRGPREHVRSVTERFEGESNPDDESILLALVCRCGTRGQFTAAFGPDTPRADAAVLVRLSHPKGPTDG